MDEYHCVSDFIYYLYGDAQPIGPFLEKIRESYHRCRRISGLGKYCTPVAPTYLAGGSAEICVCL